LYKRVINIAKGAAMMTETQVDILFDEGLSNTIPNFILEDVLKKSFRKIGVPEYTKEERAYAAKFKATFPKQEESDLPKSIIDKKKIMKNQQESELCDIFVETNHSEECSMGSTDVGDVSWVVPTGQINTNCYSYGAGAHSWQWVAQGKSTIAFKGAMLAAEVLADAAIACYQDKTIIEEAKKEFDERMNNDQYKCLIPPEVKPHLL